MKPSTQHTHPRNTGFALGLAIVMLTFGTMDVALSAQIDSVAFSSDLNRISTISAIPELNLGQSRIQLAFRTGPVTLFSESGLFQELSMSLQPSGDYQIRARMARWPGDDLVLSTSLGFQYFKQSTGSIDYSLGLNWQRSESADLMTQRDVAVLGGLLWAGERWKVQGHVGPVLQHCYTGELGYAQENSILWTGHLLIGFQSRKDWTATLSTSVSADHSGLFLNCGWSLPYGLDPAEPTPVPVPVVEDPDTIVE